MPSHTTFPQTTTEHIRKRLFFLLATALLALVVGIGLTLSFTLLGSLKQAENSRLVRIAEIRSLAVAQWCRRAKDIARQITSRTRIRQDLEKYNQGIITLEQLARFSRPKLQDAMRLSGEVRGILRLDGQNRVVTHCGWGSYLAAKPLNPATYVTDTLTLSLPLNLHKRTCIIVSAPIVNNTGQRQGTDLVIIDTEQLQAMATNPHDLAGSTRIILGYASDQGIFPFFPQKKGQAQTNFPFLHHLGPYMARAIAKSSGLAHESGLAIAYQAIEGCDWGLIITENKDELYAPLYGKLAVISGLTLVIFLGTLWGFWSIMKPMAGKILLNGDELEKKIREKTVSLEREIEERKKAEKAKEETIAQLRKAMEEIKTLSGLLPICANCKKIRDDQGYWNQIESYISEHSQATFSHGICPECAKKLYPDLKIYKD
jgi:hypothetical protein